MFTLATDNAKFLRVRRGASASELEAQLSRPVGDIFTGAIVERGEKLFPYRAKPLETYLTIAEKFGVSEDELKSINFFRQIYPTCKIYVPCKNAGGGI